MKPCSGSGSKHPKRAVLPRCGAAVCLAAAAAVSLQPSMPEPPATQATPAVLEASSRPGGTRRITFSSVPQTAHEIPAIRPPTPGEYSTAVVPSLPFRITALSAGDPTGLGTRPAAERTRCTVSRQWGCRATGDADPRWKEVARLTHAEFRVEDVDDLLVGVDARAPALLDEPTNCVTPGIRRKGPEQLSTGSRRRARSRSASRTTAHPRGGSGSSRAGGRRGQTTETTVIVAPGVGAAGTPGGSESGPGRGERPAAVARLRRRDDVSTSRYRVPRRRGPGIDRALDEIAAARRRVDGRADRPAAVRKRGPSLVRRLQESVAADHPSRAGQLADCAPISSWA
jgi:hypothetical protein